MKSLEDYLHDNAESGMIPMHMPGHKRNTSLVPSYYDHDITEIHGADNLHHPEGILAELEEEAASIWSADECILSVNGATALILSSVMATSGTVLIAANCHISVWHAIEISGRPFEVLQPDVSDDVPFYLGISPDDLEARLKSGTPVGAVVVTSPTYEGIVSDIPTIARIAHEYGASLIVDESHGAHFGIDPYFPPSSVADVVIKSIHKTLHAPTQTAILLRFGEFVSGDLIRHYMDVFESSSPSYLLLEGISRVIRDLSSEEPALAWTHALARCRKTLSAGLQHLKIYESEGADPSKIVIICAGVMTGYELAGKLRTASVEVEAAFDTHIIAMTGIGDTILSLSFFASALLAIDSSLTGTTNTSFSLTAPSSPIEMGMSISEAVRAKAQKVPADISEGLICAGYYYLYPPGVPVLIPGQRITSDRLELLSHGASRLTSIRVIK